VTTTLVDVAETFPAQTSPVAGEPRTASSVQGPFQNSANRTAWLKDRLQHIDPTKEGVRRLRRFATFAAMRASVDVPDKTVAIVDGRGLFQFEAASTVDELEPFIIRPTSIISSEPGRWVMNFYATIGAANGLAQLDANAKIPTPVLVAAEGTAKLRAKNTENGLIAIRTIENDSGHPVAVNDWTDVDGCSFDLVMLRGDFVVASGRMTKLLIDAATDKGHSIRWTANDTELFTAVTVIHRANDETSEPVGWHFFAPADGTYTFQLEHKSPNAVSVSLQDIVVTALHFRP
jgi:hypothetical protein